MKFIIKVLVCATLYFASAPSLLNAQEADCDPNLIIGPNPIKVSGAWAGDGQAVTYGVNIELKSPAGGVFSLVPNFLKEGNSDFIISGAGIATTPAQIQLDPGVNKIVNLTVAGVPASGKYSGALQFRQEGSTCLATAKIDLYAAIANQVMVIDKDQSISLKVVEPGWFSSWLPKKIAQQAIHVTLDNKGSYPVTVGNYSLWLKGDNTSYEMDENYFVLAEDADKVIPPHSYKTLRFDLDKNARVDADTYTGNLRINFNDNVASTSVSLNMSARGSAFWAIMALLMGILVGYLTRAIDNPLMKEKIDLMGKLTAVRAEGSKLQETFTIGEFQKRAAALEGRIDAIKAVEDGDALANEIDVLGGKVTTLFRLEQVIDKIPEADMDRLEPHIDTVRDNIFAGNEAEANAGFVKLSEMLKAGGPGTRGIDSATAQVYDKTLSDLETELARQASKEKALETPSSTSQVFDTLKKGFMWVFSFLLGVKINARVAYWFIRPLAVAIVFIFILWLGFWDLYVEGGDTFGADGVYDYMKLFLWGAASNILSRTMMGGGELSNISQSVLNKGGAPAA